MIVCVAGSPSIDKLFEVDRLVPGGIHRPRYFLEVPGGKGLNVARAAAALGGEVIAIGPLAGPAGRWIEEALPNYRVDGRFVWADGQTRSSLSVMDHETGRMTEFYETASAAEAAVWRQVATMIESLLPAASWLALSGSLPDGTPPDSYAQLIAAARRTGTRTSVDVRGDTLAAAVDAGPDLVKINHHEAEELCGRAVEGISGAEDAAHSIRSRAGGDGHVAAVTLGADGAVLVDPGGVSYHGRVTVDGRYPVGSGDAFLGGLLTAWRDGADWRQALARALGAGAANAETPGAGRFDPERATALAAACEPEIRRLG